MNNSVWYPYQQMQEDLHFHEVVRAEGEFLYLKNDECLVDAVSSWWAAIHGYNHPKLNQALLEQVQKFSHVMLGGLTHRPVQELADKLVQITPEGLNHVFFSDSGSVGVEVALKMAVQYWRNKGQQEKKKFISLTRAYHGDTFKAMEVGDDSDYCFSFDHVLNKGYYVSPPKGGISSSQKEIQTALEELESTLKHNSGSIAALIVEPMLQGAAGFQLYSAQYLPLAQALCEQYDILFICDEVATGFGRTGKLFACEHAEISPDIMVLGKALTAGYTGHAATIASTKIFDAFLGSEYEKAFMHGPTFMGNPLACAVALRGIEVFENDNYLEKVINIESTFKQCFENFSNDKVKEVRILGAMLVIEFKDKNELKGVQEFARQKGIWIRPFGNFLYTTPPYIIAQASLMKIIDTIIQWLNK